MKVKSLLFVCLTGLFTAAFAGNQHAPVYNEQIKPKSGVQKSQMAAPCQIEVVNQSDYTLKVEGEVTDGYGVIGIVDMFKIPVGDFPHNINLGASNGYCPYGMYVRIFKSGWLADYVAYDRLTFPGTTVVVR